MSNFNSIIKICKQELGIIPAERNGKLVNSETGEVIVIDNLDFKIEELNKKAKIEAKYKALTDYIYKYYPTSKQQSDLADKLYYENSLKANGFEDLEQVIVSKVLEFEDSKNFDALLDDVADENKDAISQLLKVAIRVTWVQRCKEELRVAIAEDREPNYPNYPLDNK